MPPKRTQKPKPKTQKRKQKKAIGVPKASPARSVTAVSVSECTKRFAEALSNPWSPKALGACLPIEPVRPSMKICVKQRISTTIGANGGCFLVVSPCVANDTAFAWYGGGAYNLSDHALIAPTATNTSLTAGVTAQNMTGLPWASMDLQSPYNRMSARIVSVGVKAQYTGTKLNEAGTWNALISPDGVDITGASNNIAALSNVPGFKWSPVTKKPVVLTSGPLDYEGYEWCAPDVRSAGSVPAVANYPWANEGMLSAAPAAMNGACPIFLMLTGGVAGQGVVFEIIVHAEYTGKLCTALTPSHNDETAAKAVLSASTAVNSSSTWHASLSNLTSGLAEILQTGTKLVTVARSAAPLLGAAARTVPLLL